MVDGGGGTVVGTGDVGGEVGGTDDEGGGGAVVDAGAVVGLVELGLAGARRHTTTEPARVRIPYTWPTVESETTDAAARLTGDVARRAAPYART
ncbi:hypothetical protein GHK86_04655 [Acidimicrobiaceae bacterium USS-CC1]|uniref:Uncharacterized protein n=1 Tax=Acidiferrimicrobium australe TaxID=2664430 RepID=A0ABW9QRD3_9ACTN|nr:hypothetical protein [Acidiferrimicrobium australe]